ncbi:hypothetical protein ACJJTC_002529 [Scirpophaga incertulas]
METIIIDDSPRKDQQTKTAIIDLLDENSNDCIEIIEHGVLHPFPEIYRENRALGEFIDKCLSLDKYGDMMRIMKRIFVPLYKDTSDVFKKSLKFERALTQAHKNMKLDPDHKFTIIRTFCEILRSDTLKKRVELITLAKNVSDRKNRKEKSCSHKNKKPRIDDTVINLVEDCDEQLNVSKHIPIISLAISDNEKNHVIEKHSIDIELSNNTIGDNPNCYNKGERIQKIEKEIAHYKAMVDSFDEMEVVDDLRSPYVQSELYQKKILHLYNQLCKITGDEPVKRHTVRLRASDTRSDVPMRKLEAMLNKSVVDNGMPNFPDFSDVVKCVIEANEEANLGWPKAQVMQEARVLFTFCGQALQRSRQKREWRSLVSRVQCKLRDPADDDPELRARLEANHKLAIQKEADILQRFSALEKKHSKGDSSDIINKANYMNLVEHAIINENTSKTCVNKSIYNEKSTDTGLNMEQSNFTDSHLVITRVFSSNSAFTEGNGHPSVIVKKSQTHDNNVNSLIGESTHKDNKSTKNFAQNIECNNNLHVAIDRNSIECRQNTNAEINNFTIQNSCANTSSSITCGNDDNPRLTESQDADGVHEVDSIYQIATNIQVTKIEIENDDITPNIELTKIEIENDDCTNICIDNNSLINIQSAVNNSDKDGGDNVKDKNMRDIPQGDQYKSNLDLKSEGQSAVSSNIVNGVDTKRSYAGQGFPTKDNVNNCLCIETPWVNVKSEPDTNQFGDLGLNYAVAINYIDPNLIIEISSDSSSDDEDCDE